MLQTPANFTPLIAPQSHDDPLTFVFHQGRLLMRDEGLDLPSMRDLEVLDCAERMHPIGLLNGRYCQATWAESDAPPAEGYGFRPLRSLFGEMDDGLLADGAGQWRALLQMRRLRAPGVSADFAGDDGVDTQGVIGVAGHACDVAY